MELDVLLRFGARSTGDVEGEEIQSVRRVTNLARRSEESQRK